MSLSAISSNPLTGSLIGSLHSHRKGTHAVNTSMTTAPNSGPLGNTSGVAVGQLPVGTSSPLFANILQSLQQTVGAQSAVTAVSGAASPTATTSAVGTAAASGTTANVQAFVHTLFQALKQDGFDAATASAAGSTAGSTAAAASSASSASSVSSDLLSSLRTLIGQVGSGAAVTPAAASLSAAYQNLVGSNGPAGTASSSTAAASSGGGLQNFLGNLLQNLQSGGVHALSTVGNHVNANV